MDDTSPAKGTNTAPSTRATTAATPRTPGGTELPGPSIPIERSIHDGYFDFSKHAAAIAALHEEKTWKERVQQTSRGSLDTVLDSR